MASIEILGGSFPAKKYFFLNSALIIPHEAGEFCKEEIHETNIESVEVMDEQNKSSILKKAGAGVVGGVLLGGVGLAAGLLAAGSGKEVVFLCTLKDGRHFLAKANGKIYQHFMTAAFRNKSENREVIPPKLVKRPPKWVDSVIKIVFCLILVFLLAKCFF